MKKKVIASVLSAVLTPAAALSTVALWSATAQAEVKKARCDVHALHVVKEGDGTIPDNLKFLEQHLREDDQFAPYKSFTLVEKKTARATLDKAAEFSFNSGHKLTIGLLGSEETKLKLHATVFGRDGDKKLLSMDYSATDGGVVFFTGGELTHNDVKGKLFFAVQCART